MAIAASGSVPSAINLRRLTWLRLLMVVFQLLTLLVVDLALHVALPYTALLATTAGYALVAGLTWLRLRMPRPVTERELFSQLLIDAGVLTILLYLSGGSTNPFVMLYLLPLSLTAAALPGRYTWAMLAVVATCSSLLLVSYRPLPDTHSSHDDAFVLHVLGMWFGLLLSAALIALFAVKMAGTLRERDQLRAAMREQELRHERVLALGTLAAGAAHEFGTPLSTMAVLVKDLTPDQPVPVGKLEILRGQIDRCKEILGSLSASAGVTRAEGGARLALDAWLGAIVRKWQVVRPGTEVQTDFRGSQPVPHIVSEQTIAQAITNILNNAADASPQCVEVRGRWTEVELELEVADRGTGLAPEVQSSIGEPFTSTKAPNQGLGLGLFLAYTALSRFGGSVRIMNREGGGVRCCLTLPLAAIKVPT